MDVSQTTELDIFALPFNSDVHILCILCDIHSEVNLTFLTFESLGSLKIWFTSFLITMGQIPGKHVYVSLLNFQPYIRHKGPFSNKNLPKTSFKIL